MASRREPSALDTANGCAKWIIIGFVALAAMIGVGVWVGSGADTVRLTGTVHISAAAACESPELEIRPEGDVWHAVRFEAASWRPGQSCVLPVDVDLPAARRYTVRMDGVAVETIEREGDAATVVIRLSW